MTDTPDPRSTPSAGKILPGKPVAEEEDRRGVERFSVGEVRSFVRQIGSLLKVLMVSSLIVVGAQVYMAVKDYHYATKAFFFSVVALMLFFQTLRYLTAMQRFAKTESKGSLIGTFAAQKNFLILLSFLSAVLAVVLILQAF